MLSVRRGASGRCSCGLAIGSRLGHAYNEEAFRYLLGVQRKRAERSDRPFLLVLVDLKEHADLGVRIEPASAHALFACLWRSLRDADLIGWYREERVAGAVLTEAGGGSLDEVSSTVTDRIARGLRGCLPAHVGDRIQVRVCRIQPTLRRSSDCTTRPSSDETTGPTGA